MDNFVIGFSTINSVDGANEIARAFVNEGIAACVNIIPHLQSIYKWKGEVCAETELLMIIKTKKENIDKIKERMTELHPYDVPELIFTDIKDGLPSYLDWIEANS